MSNISHKSLEKALAQLKDAIIVFNKYQNNSELASHLRDGAIQAFEYTYELSWKILKKHLAELLPNPDTISSNSFKDVIRLSYEHQLIKGDLQQWVEFRTLRGTTSHVYNEEKAINVFNELDNFIEEVEFIINKLNQI